METKDIILLFENVRFYIVYSHPILTLKSGYIMLTGHQIRPDKLKTLVAHFVYTSLDTVVSIISWSLYYIQNVSNMRQWQIA